MKKEITISQKDFSNKFDSVLLNNATIHTILSKETNLGFTTKLVTDQLKAELMASIFEEEEVETETAEAPAQTSGEAPSDAEPSEDKEEPTDANNEANDALDELDELD